MKILNIDNMLEAAQDSKMPKYDELALAAEDLACRLSGALAAHLKIKVHDQGSWMGEALGGLCASFGPMRKGQKCPAVIEAGDPGGDWEIVR